MSFLIKKINDLVVDWITLINWRSLAIYLAIHSLFIGFVFSQLVKGGESGGIAIFNSFFSLCLSLAIVSLLSMTLPISRIIKLVACYCLAYPIISVLIRTFLATIHTNDKEFRFWQDGVYQQDHFFFIALLLIFSSIAYFIRLRQERLFTEDGRWLWLEEAFLSYTLSVTLMNHEALVNHLWPMVSGQGEQGSFTVGVLLPLFKLLCSYMISHHLIKAIRTVSFNQSNFSLAVVSSLSMGIVTSYFLQSAIVLDTALLGLFPFQNAVSFQVISLSLVYLLLYLVINRYLLVTLMNIAWSSLLVVANELKFSFRQEPILLTDLVWLREIETVADFVDQSLYSKSLTLLLTVALAYLILRNWLLKGRVLRNNSVRLSGIVIIASIFLFVRHVFQQENSGKIPDSYPILSRLNNDNPIAWLGFGTNAQYKSLSYVWVKQLTSRVMDKPDDYSKERIEQLVSKYTGLSEELNKTRPNQLSDETVIFVLSESFSDPNRVDGVSVSYDPIPYIREIKTQTTSGLMKSDGFGGATANMEFQSLTGLPLYNLSPNVSLAYLEVVPRLAYFPSLSQLFKEENRIVIHPDSPRNYNRHKIYEQLGFAEFVAHKDTDTPISAPVSVGALISDQTVYKNILSRLKTDESQFFSIITMQNHSPWILDEPADLIARGEGFSQVADGHLASYVRLISHTDYETKVFLDELSQLDKKITVVFYGDHLPGFYPSHAFTKNPDSQYQTDYFIWSNHETKRLDYPLLNSSDFTAALLEQLDVKVTPYQALLTQVLKHASVDKESFTELGQQISDDFKLIQYDITAGKGYLTNHQEFFGGNE